jgi:hypothetical protein
MSHVLLVMVLTDSRPKDRDLLFKAAFTDPCDCTRIAGGGLEFELVWRVAAGCGLGFGVALKNAEVFALALTLAFAIP